MAMEVEAAPIISALRMVSVPSANRSALPLKVYRCVHESTDVVLVLNGKDRDNGVDNIATQPATLAAFYAIKEFFPTLLINAGTAGGFGKRGAAIGDVYVGADKIIFHDRRIPLPNFEKYGLGLYPTPDVSRLAKKLGLKVGRISTGNSLDMTTEDRAIMESHDIVVKDMEAAAIAWVAHVFGIQLLVVKAITDIVDSSRPPQEAFIENLTLASHNLKDKIIAILNYCAESPE